MLKKLLRSLHPRKQGDDALPSACELEDGLSGGSRSCRILCHTSGKFSDDYALKVVPLFSGSASINGAPANVTSSLHGVLSAWARVEWQRAGVAFLAQMWVACLQSNVEGPRCEGQEAEVNRNMAVAREGLMKYAAQFDRAFAAIADKR